MNRTVKTEISDTLAGADELKALADKLGLERTEEVMQIAACAAGDAYWHAGELLEEKGHLLNAREAFEKAKEQYERAGRMGKMRRAERRVYINYPPSGNIYGE